MKICIYGAGAIGCWLGSRLVSGGYEPFLVARGEHGNALKRHGLKATEAGETRQVSVDAYLDTESLPPFDVAFVTLKAHSIAAAVPHLAHHMSENTTALFAVNGIPWWFYYGLGQDHDERTVQSVDPSGEIWHSIQPKRALGCVIYPAVELVAPGEIRHVSGERMSIGEPGGGPSERTEQIENTLNACGVRTSVRRDIRNEMWIKLWGNVAFNPMSVLTGGTLDQLATDPGTQQIAETLMLETQSVGQFYGARFGMSIEKRIENAAAVGAHKTSMLQDYLQGKPLESSAILDAVIELAEYAKIDVPMIHAMKSLLSIKLQNELHNA